MVSSSAIAKHEIPPRNEDEWAEVLAIYGKDRDSSKLQPAYRRTDNGTLERECNPRPIIHHADIDESFEAEATTGGRPPFPRPPVKPSRSFGGLSERPGSSSGSARSTVSGEQPTMALGIISALGAPPKKINKFSGTPDWDTEQERLRMRRHYEHHGWLPGPLPSESKRLLKKRAILRLGIGASSTPEDDRERRSVIAKYSEMAQDIFQCPYAAVNIHGCFAQLTFGANPGDAMTTTELDVAVCGHALIHPNVRTTVVSDLSTDWRFAQNPVVQQMGFKFYAAAPLRCSWKDTEIDIATLCIYDTKPRETFDAREQTMLVNLANMLVYQLTTLEGQASAKRTKAMYEQSFNFLRRSILPDEAKRSMEKKKRPKQDTKRSQLSKSPRPRHISLGESAEPLFASKNGPRDSRNAKTLAAMSESALFNDSASTLRNILHADHVSIVDLSDYTLFIRRVNDLAGKKAGKSREVIISDFLAGKPWPSDYEPVIHHTPKGNQTGVNILGSDSDGLTCNWQDPDSVRTVRDFAESWIKDRHFWWDREDDDDELNNRVMRLMPAEANTTLATAFITYDGRLRFAMFASWKSNPSAFADSNIASLPFTYILGGCTAAALAIRKIRSLEHSQISYSNLQAHELRTPLHQILAVTQLLRSSMNDLADAPQQMQSGSLTTMEQVRDLLPLLDAIDTSGKTLHGIVDNILSFLDLKSKDNMLAPTTPALLSSPSGAAQTIEAMFEELIHETSEEDVRSRQANSQPLSHVETVFEISPSSLGRHVTEDSGGALRRALGKILANAYKFIDGNGVVEIYVKNVEEECPNGCEELALSKKISIEIRDNGRGMDPEFVRNKLGEPWAKEDQYTTGSGLSVHLAYRIIDLMGGDMEISSAPGHGCIVHIQVALPLRQEGSPHQKFPSLEQVDTDHDAAGRKVALIGFDDPHHHLGGHNKLETALARQLTNFGAHIVPPAEAELIIANGHLEESAVRGRALLDSTPATHFVFYVTDGHEPHPLLADLFASKSVRRYQKPITPSLIREALFPGQSKFQHVIASSALSRGRPSIPRSDTSDSGDREVVQPGKTVPETRLKAHFEPAESPANGTTLCPIVAKLCSFWKPKNVPVEDAVACLSLGDYINSHRRTSINRTPSLGGSSNAASSAGSLPETPGACSEADPAEASATGSPVDEVAPPVDIPKVLVVEDNRINRKILVKLLSSKTPIEVVEAADGQEAVDLFREFDGPAIVLLDINMPKMDGFQASFEMREIERKTKRRKSQIIAVTALAGEAEKHKGLVECGMDTWMTKPCGKVAIHRAIDDAKEALGLGNKEIGLGINVV
ncbi:hypothetical protein BD324DRAFT_615975 [Kockovaella imperatae]|uniref:histidine kinase n=1 Tax=Kockovaella imperatae TaxID=4999 RepID=A0A1Y1UPN5_9TREE|nr:hypothetical protein BD324DRAFT_615975 [Kockovaella imperatae]ORX40020.1 hypothetical protein BD324DRAFT_615975 [Kockovaella imperatae]